MTFYEVNTLGTWGIKIFQNDDAADLRESYRERIILGVPDEEAEQAVIQEFSIGGNFSLWLPLAVTQWKIGRLSETVKENALHEIKVELSCLDERWKPNEASKRRQELANAEVQICSQQPARKKLRMPWWAWKCPWPTGSILQFRIQYPKENNPLLGEYVMLQILGVSETLPNEIPCEVINVGLYFWHSKIPPDKQLDEIEANPPALIGFLTKSGEIQTSRCISIISKDIKENEIKCIRETPFIPSEIEPIRNNVPSNSLFQNIVCRTLLSQA